MKQRNLALELYRVLLMLGIVAYHTLIVLKPFGRGLDNVFDTCVVGFVLISGWFGIQFSCTKVLKLLCTGFYCGIVAALLHSIFFGCRSFGCFVGLVWWHLQCFWFLWAYILLMTLAPLVNDVVSDCKNIKLILPFLVAVFGWSYLHQFPIIGAHIPSPAGFGPSAVLTLLAIYCVARLAKVSALDARLKKWQIAALFIVGLVGSWVGLYHYNSPFALILSLSTFVAFSHLKVPQTIGRVCKLLSPSLFSVYLIHTTAIGFHIMKKLDWHWVFVVFVIFIGCVMLDLPRRVIAAILSHGRFYGTKN